MQVCMRSCNEMFGFKSCPKDVSQSRSTKVCVCVAKELCAFRSCLPQRCFQGDVSAFFVQFYHELHGFGRCPKDAFKLMVMQVYVQF